MVAQLDFDKSGSVNMYEFDSNGETATANDEDGGAEQASSQQGSNHNIFSNYDENNDGEITKAELALYLSSVSDDATEGDVEVRFHNSLITTRK